MWSIIIRDDLQTTHIKVWIIDDSGDNRAVLYPKKDQMVVKTFKKYSGEEIKPSLTFPQDCLKSLADALNNFGVKTEDEAKTKGTLEAQKYHLEDLRKLLNLKDK